MKRVSKKFKPNGCNYKYHFKTYFEQPKGTVIMYYLRDNDNNYTAVCRHKFYLRKIILMITVILCLYRLYKMEGTSAKVYAPKYLTMRGNILSLDLKYNKQSNIVCYYSLSLEGKMITDGLLEPGESIGNIKVDGVLADGDYPAVLTFKIEDSYGHKKISEKNVLLQVRNTTE